MSVEIGCNLVCSVNSNLGDLLCKHADVFKPELSLLTGFKAKLHVKSDAIPKFCRARTVPFALLRLLSRRWRSKVLYHQFSFHHGQHQ